MCGNMIDIQSATTDTRQEERKKRRNHSGRMSLPDWVTIKSGSQISSIPVLILMAGHTQNLTCLQHVSLAQDKLPRTVIAQSFNEVTSTTLS